MRVSVNHTDPDHSNATKFAYRLGRAQDGTDFVTGEERSRDDIIAKLLESAKAEYPEADGYTHEVEAFVDNGDGTGEWVPADQAKDQNPVAPGQVQDVQFNTGVQAQASTE